MGIHMATVVRFLSIPPYKAAMEERKFIRNYVEDARKRHG